MKYFTNLLATASLVNLLLADSACSKNAWVLFKTQRVGDGNGDTCGTMSITSGQGAWDLPTTAAMHALGLCAYEGVNCRGNWVNNHWEMCCKDKPQWKAYYAGSMNIEFGCSNGKEFICHDLNWA